MDLFAKDRSAEKSPFVLLTGFLGSGKTTLLTRLLRQPAMKDSAVIVNEIGEIGLDHDLLETVEGEVALLPSGCVCCTLRGDLAEALRRLLIRRQRGEIPEFARVVVETTGLADPAPILQLALSDPLIAHYFRIEATIATVDAVHARRQLDEHPEAAKQVALADRLLLTKTDLIEPAVAAEIEEDLAAINPLAARHVVRHGEIAPDVLFAGGPYDAKRRGIDPERWLGAPHLAHPQRHEPGHDHGLLDPARRIRTFSLEFDRPLDWPTVANWLNALRSGAGEGLLRIKGILDLAGEERPVAIHGIHHVLHPPTALAAWPSAKRRSRIVFITRGLSREAVADSWKSFVGASVE
jgi:G3E family GTPase